MKMKKLVSIGALGLVLACSTSIGASAASTYPDLTDQQKTVVKALVETYNAGGEPIKNLDVDKATAVSSVLNLDSDYYAKLETKLSAYKQGNVILELIDSGATIDGVFSISLEYGASTEERFTTFKSMVNKLSEKFADIDDTENPEDKAAKEAELVEMINDEYGTITFGVNSAGATTFSLEKNDKVILQLDLETATALFGIIENCNNVEDFREAITEYGLQ